MSTDPGSTADNDVATSPGAGSPASDGSPGTEANHGSLTIWIVAAIAAAVVFAALLPMLFGAGWVESPTDAAPRSWGQVLVEDVLAVGGEVFLNILFMLVVPLVVTSVMAGILSLGDVRKLGRPGLYAILYYLTTTVLAVSVGILLANLFRPGLRTDDDSPRVASGEAVVAEAVAEGADVAAEPAVASEAEAELARRRAAAGEEAPQTVGDIIRNLIETIFTKNLINAAATQQLLPLIVFSIVFAAILTTRPVASQTLQRLIVEAADMLMVFVLLVMKLAPVGIFCLVAGRFGEATLKGEFADTVRTLGWYSATVTTGLMVHALITLPLIYWMIRGENPYRFLVRMSQALLTAFGTSSSSATLPVTIETATENAGVSKKAAGFVLPLGATINMDGTALYEATAALFIAQLAGLDLGAGEQITIAVTATLAAIGAAGVPEAGLVTMLIVLKAVGLSEKYVATILPIDWLLDRVRTTVNVFGDATGAAVLTPQLPDGPLDHHLAQSTLAPAEGTGAGEGTTRVVPELAGAAQPAVASQHVGGVSDGEPSPTVEMGHDTLASLANRGQTPPPTPTADYGEPSETLEITERPKPPSVGDEPDLTEDLPSPPA